MAVHRAALRRERVQTHQRGYRGAIARQGQLAGQSKTVPGAELDVPTLCREHLAGRITDTATPYGDVDRAADRFRCSAQVRSESPLGRETRRSR